MVDALVSFGYSFEPLQKMTFSDLRDWLKVAIARGRQN